MAFSGGLDSTVLLTLLTEIRAQLPAPLHAIHLNHGLQEAAPRWAAHCQQVCNGLDVVLVQATLTISQKAPGMSLETAAREARYAAFRARMAVGDGLLTAHHRDDQAETVLFRLLRGSGNTGLAGIRPFSPCPPGWLGRPLLAFGRDEILATARARRLIWVEDPSNRDTRHDRNFLRHQVWPLLAGRWPGLSQTLARTAGHCAEVDDILEHWAAEILPGLAGDQPGTLSASRLAVFSRPQARALLRHWIRQANLDPKPKLPDQRRLAAILDDLLPAAIDRCPLVAWEGTEIRRFRDALYLLPTLPAVPADLLLPWRDDEPLRLPAGYGRLHWAKVAAGGLLAGAIQGARVTVGWRAGRAGDAALSRRLKHLWQRAGIPPWVRERWPVVCLDGQPAALASLAVLPPFEGAEAGVFFPVWKEPDWASGFFKRLEDGPNPGDCL